MPRPARPGSPALQDLHDRCIGDDPEMIAAYKEGRANSEVAQAVYDLRAEAGLTQAQLARRVGTVASVISRLEDADYSGHSLSMLRRIAAAVGRRVELRFPLAPGAAAAPPAAVPPDGKRKRKARGG